MSNSVFQTSVFQKVILCVAGFILLTFVFGLGVFVGTKKAEFSYRWAEQYHRNFAGPQQGFLGDIRGRDFMDANGSFGQIIRIDGQMLTIKNMNSVEKNILVGQRTIIMCQKRNLALSDLTIGDNIVIIGEPNSLGQISANLIRLMPSPK
jgi:hypothetical protein